MGRATAHPERVLGLHFFSPASVMRRVEVIPGTRTGEDAMSTAMDLVAQIGTTPVAVAGAAGRDVAERYYRAAVDEARRCVAEGVAAPDDIDLAITLGGGWEAEPLTWDQGRAR